MSLIYLIKHREKIETNLNFLGLVIMENRLKPQTEGKHYFLSLEILNNSI